MAKLKGLFLFLIPFIIIFSLIFCSDEFRVKNVIKEGFYRVSPEIVDSFIKKGEFIFSVDLGEIEKRLEANLWIKRASIYRKLPSTIVVKVLERNPELMFLENGELYYVDQFGDVFKKVGAYDRKDFPIAYGFDKNNLDEVISLVQDFFRDKALSRHPISQIWKEGMDIYILTEDGAEIILNGSDVRSSLKRVSKFLRYNHGSIPRRIDARFSGRVIVRR